MIDGQFSDVEERDRIAMNDSDKVKLDAALQLIPKALSLGIAEDWEQPHRLAKLAKVQSGFSEDGDPDELRWWNKQLFRAACDATRLPLIETKRGFLQGLYDEKDDYAEFIIPRYSRTTTSDQVPQAKSWKVASDTWLLDSTNRNSVRGSQRA